MYVNAIVCEMLGISQIESPEGESKRLESTDTNIEHWICFDRDSTTFGALSDRDKTGTQTKKPRRKLLMTVTSDEDESDVQVTRKETRIVLEILKGRVHKYGNNGTFQLFQNLQEQRTYIVAYIIIKN